MDFNSLRTLMDLQNVWTNVSVHSSNYSVNKLENEKVCIFFKTEKNYSTIIKGFSFRKRKPLVLFGSLSFVYDNIKKFQKDLNKNWPHSG